MCDPVTMPPLISKASKLSCDPTYEFEHLLPNGKKVCLRKLIADGPVSQPIGIPPSPTLIFEEDKVIRDQTRFITGTAEYSCKTKTPITEYRTVPRDVSVTRIPNESENVTRARLEQAARELTKTITGCHDVKFERLQPIANGHTKSAAPHSKPTTEVANKCEGEWATRSVCRK